METPGTTTVTLSPADFAQDSLSRSFYRDPADYLMPEWYDPFNGQNTYISHFPVKPFILGGAQAEPGAGTAHKVQNYDWIFWLIVMAFALLTFTRVFYERRFKLMVSAVFSRNAARLASGERSIFQHQSFVLILMAAIISGALFIYQVLHFFNPELVQGIQGIWLTLQIFGGWLAYYLLKVLLIRTSGVIFRNKAISAEYIQNIFIFSLFTGVILLPLTLLATYLSPAPFIYTALVILTFIMVIRFFRGFLIGLSDPKFSVLHLFLYLCTLEILPVVFIAKFAELYFL